MPDRGRRPRSEVPDARVQARRRPVATRTEALNGLSVALIEISGAAGLIMGTVIVRLGRGRRSGKTVVFGTITIIWALAVLLSHLPGVQVPDVISVLMSGVALLAIGAYSFWLVATRGSR